MGPPQWSPGEGVGPSIAGMGALPNAGGLHEHLFGLHGLGLALDDPLLGEAPGRWGGGVLGGLAQALVQPHVLRRLQVVQVVLADEVAQQRQDDGDDAHLRFGGRGMSR